MIRCGIKALGFHSPDLSLKRPCCQTTFPIQQDMPATSAPPGGCCSRFVPYFCRLLQWSNPRHNWHCCCVFWRRVVVAVSRVCSGGLGTANSKSGDYNLFSSDWVLELLRWPQCWFHKIEICAMHRYIPLGLNQLLNVEVDQWFHICIVDTCQWVYVLVEGLFC